MTETEFVTMNEDFIDFLNKIVRNYDVNYPQLAAMIMARMVSLAIISNSEDVLLKLLPEMEKNLNDNNRIGPIH
jgi:translation elongation factor EF-Ts